MSLSIAYTNSHASHTRLGSVLRGTVHFTSPKDEAIAKVNVTFSGRCKVKIREHLHYTTRSFRSRGYYFHLTKQVFDGGGFTHRAGEYAWPFEFKVPDVAEPQWEVDAPTSKGVKGRRVLDKNGIMQVALLDEGEDGRGKEKFDNFPPESPWRASKDLRPHNLPESFKVEDSRKSVDWEGRVEYALIAKVERPAGGSKIFSLGKVGTVEVFVDVPLKTTLDNAARTMLRVRQTLMFERRISGGGDKKGKGVVRALSKLKRRTTNTSTKETAPSGRTVVLFTVDTPRAVQSQSTLPFVIKAMITIPLNSMPTLSETWSSQYQEAPPTLVDPIIASITDLAVSLQRKTSVRDDRLAATEHTAVGLEKDVLCWRRDQVGIDLVMAPVLISSLETDADKIEGSATRDSVTMQGEADLEDLIHTPALAPSFSTYNIAVEYKLEFEMKLVLLGETMTLSSTSSESGYPRIVVVPASSNVDGEGEEKVGKSGTAEGRKKGSKQESSGKVLSKEAEVAMERRTREQRRTENTSADEEELPAYQP